MNKTIIININGIVFHIEEDAYEILKNYMTDVKRHFLNSADSLEITTDIENRIAEMFSDILTKDNKQVIVEQDVNLVIEQMGRVEDFEVDEDNAKSAAADNAYTYNNIGSRKLFRDPDEHLLGGVCSGIAHYFGIEAVWIRLAFALAFFFAGSGLLLYIVLWIVVPKAITRADRMAMNGEKLNLQGFKNSFEEELSGVRNHFNNLHQEAQPVIYKFRDFVTDVAHNVALFFNGAGRMLIKFIGVLILIAFFAMAIGLVVLAVSFISFGAARYNHIFPFTIIEYEYANRIYVSAFLTVFIPVLAIILVLISAIFGARSIGRSSSTTLLIVWLCALAVLTYYSVRAASRFRASSKISQVIKLNATPGNIYYLKLNDVKYLTHEDSMRLDVKNNFNNMIIKNDEDDDPEPRNVFISIEKSDVSQPQLIETFRAQGADDEDALLNARNTRYIFSQQDSVLKFDDKLRRIKGDMWHDEEVYLTLQVPLNSKVVIDQELADNIDLNGVNVNDCKVSDKQDNATSAAFIMTDDGLQCKIDTVVMVKTPAQIDSARKAGDLKTIAKLHAQIDSVHRADSLTIKK